ncbi:Hsp20/alpha crystallin family protein [Radiobacillus sp. PE A8.2]|uniref:Hsp20/alpha crystallin family protein n=1 Tax=Radiobacillus sp. PE A8.2 TaxID=3380349 RepID=UPI00388E5C27
MAEESKYSSKRSKRNVRNNTNTSPDFLRQMDDFFQLKPTNNIMASIDSFFQNNTPQKSIPVDMYETDKEWIVEVDVPGVNKENIHLDVVGDRLKIRLSNDQDVKKYDESNSYYHRERRYYQSEREVTLPYAVDKKTAKAKYRNGVLEIRGPKKPRTDYNLDIE